MKKHYCMSVLVSGVACVALGFDRPVVISGITGDKQVLRAATVSFAASEEDCLLYMAWDESDRGEDINSWRRFRHVVVPAGSVTATIPAYEPIDITKTMVKFFFAPTNAAPYDAAVEYVEATGEQYIDTGVYANGKTTAVKADFAFTTPGTYEDTIFGAADGNNISDPLGFHFNFRLNKAGRYTFNCKDISHHTGISVANSSDRLLVTLDSPGRLCEVINKTLGETVYSYNMPNDWPHSKTATRTMAIFANNGHDPIDCFARAKLYALEIYAAAISSGESPVRSYVPVVSEGVGCLWDSVSGKLYRSVGTADLVASPTLLENASIAGAIASSDAINDFPAVSPTMNVTTRGTIGTTRTIDVSLLDYGFGTSELKIEMLYSRNEDYSDPICETLETAYSGSMPYSGTRTLLNLVQNVPYYGKLVVTIGAEAFEMPFTFECPSTSEMFFWTPTCGSAWEEPANWRIGEMTATTVPGEYDTAFLGGSGNVRLELNRDRLVSNVWQNILASYGGKDGQSGCYTFNLHGHSLNIVNDYSFGRTLIQGAATTMLITNGIVRVGGKTDIGGPSPVDWRCAKLFLRGCETFLNSEGQFGVGGYGDNCGVEVSCGAKLTINGKLNIEAGSQRYHSTSPYKGPTYFDVVGDGTEVVANNGMEVRNWARLTIRDKAKMTLRGCLAVEQNKINAVCSFRNYGELVVSDATFDAGSNAFGLGVATHWKVGSAQQVGANGRIEIVSNGVMRLSGSDARLWVGYAFSEAVCTNNIVRVADGGFLDMSNASHAQGILISSGGIPQTGAIPRCDNGLDVENGTVYARSLTVGNSENRSNNWIRVAGKTSRIVLSDAVNSLNLNYHTTMRFDIDEDGFANVPIYCAGAIKSKRSQSLNVPSEIIIDARKYARKHPRTSITLIESAVESEEALTELCANATFVGALRNPSVGGELTVVEGRKLVMTTRPRPGLAIVVR